MIDKYLNAVTSGLVSACGAGPVTPHTRARGEQVDGKWVVLVDVSPSSKPVFARTGKYVRANNTTRQLGIAEAHEYIGTRWPN
jgi:predicted HTH transcriptional regulator